MFDVFAPELGVSKRALLSTREQLNRTVMTHCTGTACHEGTVYVTQAQRSTLYEDCCVQTVFSLPNTCVQTVVT